MNKDEFPSPENGRHAAPELEREAFKAWADDMGLDTHNPEGFAYDVDSRTAYAWAAWQARASAQAPVVPPTDAQICTLLAEHGIGWGGFDNHTGNTVKAHAPTDEEAMDHYLPFARALLKSANPPAQVTERQLQVLHGLPMLLDHLGETEAAEVLSALLAAHLQARTQDLTGKNASRSDSAESDAQAAERAAGIEFCAKWHDRKAWEHRAAGRTVNDLFHHTAAAELRALLLAPEDQNHSVAAGMHPPKPNEGTVWVHESHIDFATANAALAKVETNAAYHLHGDGTRSYLVSIHSLVAAGVSLPSEANGLSGGQS
jgi:hypothetical protein